MAEPLYTIGTWDTEAQAFTPQPGMEAPSQNVPWTGLLRALRELRAMGYTCHYLRDARGDHDNNDPFVLVERVNPDPREA